MIQHMKYPNICTIYYYLQQYTPSNQKEKAQHNQIEWNRNVEMNVRPGWWFGLPPHNMNNKITFNFHFEMKSFKKKGHFIASHSATIK